MMWLFENRKKSACSDLTFWRRMLSVWRVCLTSSFERLPGDRWRML